MSDRMPKRRDVLKSVGTASGVLIGSSTVATARQVSEQIDEEAATALQRVTEDVEKISGHEQYRIIGRARKDFNELYKVVRNNHPNFRYESVTAYRSEVLGDDFVIWRLENRKEDSKAQISVRVENRGIEADKEFQSAKIPTKASIRSIKDGSFEGIDEYHLDTSAKRPPRGSSVASTQGTEAASEKSMTSEDKDTRAIHVSADVNDILKGNQGFQTQSSDDEFSCSVCKPMVTAINTTTCGLSSVVACSALTSSIGPLGPMGCAVGIGLICTFITNYGTSDPDDVCAGEDAFGNEVVPGMPCD